MTDAYFYVNIPYHRPATPSFFRLLQRWAGPLLLGTVLATLAWRQDHLAPAASQTATTQPAIAQTAAQPVAQPTGQASAAAPADAQDASTFGGYTAAAHADDDAPQAFTTQAAATQPAATTQFTATTQPAHVGTHPALVFHNCSVPRMEVKKDRNDMISGVASVSSCDEAKVTLWDTSR